jgi:hypothetical protein
MGTSVEEIGYVTHSRYKKTSRQIEGTCSNLYKKIVAVFSMIIDQ